MRESGRFFTHGEVSVLEEDAQTGQASLSVVLPACVMQAVTPQLLAAGLIDDYELRRPLAVWMPTISDAGFRPGRPETVAFVNAEIRARVQAALEFFHDAQAFLLFPGDALPMLPMGTYVRFRLRCDVDKLVLAVQSMGGAAGVAELKYAFSSVVAALLSRWGRAGSSPPALSEGSYQGRRRRAGPGRGPSSSR